MHNNPKYLKFSYIDDDNLEVVSRVAALIQDSIRLMTNIPLSQVIESLEIKQGLEVGNSCDNTITFSLRIYPQYKAMVFGRQFANIVSLRRLISNASGLNKVFFKLVIEDR